jgi:hypothetical protein
MPEAWDGRPPPRKTVLASRFGDQPVPEGVGGIFHVYTALTEAPTGGDSKSCLTGADVRGVPGGLLYKLSFAELAGVSAAWSTTAPGSARLPGARS